MNVVSTSLVALLSIAVALFYKKESIMSTFATSSAGKSILQGHIVCFGDSITQGSWVPGGTGAALANAYQRKLDVINRGFSGYNTPWGIEVMKQWLPRKGEDRPRISLMLIWFGANDAAVPPSPQSVTIEDFKANLHQMISFLADKSSPYYSPNTKILLLTPPPVNAGIRNAALAARDPPQVPDRDAERTKQFAIAVLEVGKEAGLPTVNTWSDITAAAEKDGGLEKYLSDGLHLTADGYQVVTGGVANAIATYLPELHWDKLDQVFPHWHDIIHKGALGSQFVAADPNPTLIKK